MAISEIGATYPDSTFGTESREGEPFIVTYIYNFSYVPVGVT